MHKLNDLFTQIMPVILNRQNPFDTITIVVPSKKIEQWFKTIYLKTYNDVLMNVKFIRLNDFFLSKVDNKYKLINKNVVRTYFIKNIVKLNDTTLSSLQDILKDYLNDDKLKSIKVYDLANKLAELYVSYDLDNILDNKISSTTDDLFKVVDKDLFDSNYVSLSRLYKEIKSDDLNPNIYFFGFSNLSIIENKILEPFINKYKDNFYILNKDEPFIYNLKSVVSSPSKFREVERLHSDICELLINDKEHNLSLSDFLVLAPNISEYRSIIASVFKQDNINYVDLPYTICYKDENSNHLYKALKLIFDIYNNKSFTRSDFINLIENKIIKCVRGLDDEDINAIKQSILNSNTYRNKEDNSYDDWELLKRRLLASKILLKSDDCNHYIPINSHDYSSFSALNLDDNRIIKIISLIDDLKEVISLNKITIYKYDDIKSILDKYFSLKENEIETNNQYKKLLDEIDLFNKLNINLNKDNLNILFYDLLDISSSNRFISGELFTKGITFLDLDDKSIINSKYIFILGCDSKSLDFNTVKSEVDIRNDVDFSNKVMLKEKLFKLQASNTEYLYISYVNQDLKSGEEYFIAPLIKEINPSINQEIMDLDEKRNYSKLFTRREKENKDYYEQLFKGEKI